MPNFRERHYRDGIRNWWYVSGVEGYIAPFAAGTLPV
jgi:hypothetical protein